MPAPAHSSSAATAAPRQRHPRLGAAANSSVARVNPCTPIAAAGWIIVSPAQPGSSHTLPMGFQGKPVAMNWRARSVSVQAPARANARLHPGLASRAIPAVTPVNSARIADRPGTARGTSHQKRAASIKMASVIQ